MKIGVVGLGLIGGAVARAMSANGSIEVLEDSETAIIKISALLSSHGAFTACVAGLILAGILAATMSTADSQLLAAASSASDDIFGKMIFKDNDSKRSMIVARVAVVVMSIIALFIASNPDSSVFQIVSFAWAGFGAAFGPLILLALFWKRTNLAGAVSGMVTGAITCFVWKFWLSGCAADCPIFGLYELVPGFLLAFIVTVAVSLLTKKPSDDMLKEFDAVSGNIPMTVYLAKVREAMRGVLADDKVSPGEVERIKSLLDEMPEEK